MQKHGQGCAGLIEMTADALSGAVVAVMLVAVQRDNLELSIKQAIKRSVFCIEGQERNECRPIPGPILFLNKNNEHGVQF